MSVAQGGPAHKPTGVVHTTACVSLKADVARRSVADLRRPDEAMCTTIRAAWHGRIQALNTTKFWRLAEAIRGSPNVTLRSGHHVSQDAAVLGAVNALRLRFDRANVPRPTGIDSARAQRANTAFT